MADRSVVVKLRAEVGQYVSGLEQAKTATGKFGDDVQKHSKGASADIQRIGTAGVVAGGALVAGLGAAVFTAANFEKEMSGVRAVSGASADEMKRLSDAAIAAGASTKLAGVTAMDAAAAEAELVKAGVSVSDVLGGALMGSLTLGAAGQLDFAQSATIAAQAMNIFNLAGSDVSHIADVLAAAANKSAGDVGQFGDALRQGGLLAAQTGLSLEETVGTLAAFADNALIGSDAGTSLKTMLQRLGNPSKEAATLMADLGISAYDAQGNFVGLETLSGQLQNAFGDLTQAQRDQAASTIFGSDAVRAANVLYAEGAAGIKNYVDAVDDQGAAARMAAIQNDNLKGDLEALGGAFEAALIDNGSKATSALRSVTQEVTDFISSFSAMPDLAQTATIGLGGLVGVVSLVGGGFIKLAPQIRESKLALEAMDSTVANFAGRNMGAITGGLAGVTAAIGAGIFIYGKATEASRAYEATVSELAESLKPVTEGQTGLNQALTDFLEIQSTDLSTDALSALNAMKVTVGDIQSSIKSGGDALDPMRDAVKALGVDLQGVDLGALDDPSNPQVLHALATALGVSDQAVRDLIETTEDWDDAAQDAAEKQVQAAESAGTFSDKAVQAAIDTNTAKDGTTNWVAVLDMLAPSVENVGGAADEASGGIADLAGAEDDAAEAAQGLKDAIEELMTPLDTQGAVDDFTQGIHDMGDAFAEADANAADAKDSLADAQKNLTDKQQDLTDLLKTPKKERGDDFDRRVAAARDAVTDAREGIAEAQERLNDALDETSRKLLGNSDAALRNRDIMRDVTDSAAQAIQQAAADETMSLSDVIDLRASMIDQIEDEAEKVGLTKAAVQKYIDVINNIPLDVTTTATFIPLVEATGGGGSTSGPKTRAATGGLITAAGVDPIYRAAGGPVGTDTIPAWLSPNEYVQSASAVSKYGLEFMHAVNAGTYQPVLGAGMSASYDQSRNVHMPVQIQTYGDEPRRVRDITHGLRVLQTEMSAA